MISGPDFAGTVTLAAVAAAAQRAGKYAAMRYLRII
jgi:hypothetical protein